jgi:hypothetical protein
LPVRRAPGDETAAALLVERLGMSEADWEAKHAEVVELMISNKRAIQAVGSALLEHGALPGAEVHRLVDEALAEEVTCGY